MLGVVLVVCPLIGAALVIMGMLREHEEHQKVRMKRLRPDRYGLSRTQLGRITADVLRRDRRRARYGWQA
jgi:hypothetical protein